MSARIDALLKLLERGQDSALLRFSLGTEYLASGEPDVAATHLRSATQQDSQYSAAWKLLGKALAEAGDSPAAEAAYQSGIEAATRNGDRQAAKEMSVFLKRLLRERQAGNS